MSNIPKRKPTIDTTPVANVQPTEAEKAALDDAEWEQRIAESKENTAKTQEAIEAVKEEPKIEEPKVEQSTITPPTPEQIEAYLKQQEEAKNKQDQDTKMLEEAARKQKIAKTNDASDFMYFDNGNDDDLEAAFKADMEQDEREESLKTSEPNDYVTMLAKCLHYGQRTEQHRLLVRFIKLLEENNIKLEEMNKSLRMAKISPNFGDKPGTKFLTGNSAISAVLSHTVGLYRIMLYNSGFWITIKPITVADCDAFQREVDREAKELGRIVGGFYHLIKDVFLKRKVIDFLSTIVVGSNLQGYNEPNVLADNISIQDYDTILWALSYLMYRDGIGVGVCCTNPDCRHIDDNQFIDLSNACYFNTTAFNPDAIAWMQTIHATRTKEDLVKYRETILKQVKDVDDNDGTIIYTLKVPSLLQIVNKGEALVGEIAKLVNSKATDNIDDLTNQLTLQLYKMFAPWVYKVVLADKKGNIETRDYNAILTCLNTHNLSISSANPLYDKIEEFIRNTKCTYYGLRSIQCPKCHKKPEFNKTDIFPLDVQYIFFCLSCLRVAQTGISV